MSDDDRTAIPPSITEAADPALLRMAAELLAQGWPLWQIRQHLDWLENRQAAKSTSARAVTSNSNDPVEEDHRATDEAAAKVRDPVLSGP